MNMNKNKTIGVWSYLEEYKEYDKEIIRIVNKVFASGKLILGDEVKNFEINFSKWINTKYGTGVANGTDAIKLALLALDVGPGDEVITVSNTAVPSVSAIVETGANPVFCDVNTDDYNICINDVEELITKKTKAILCVHLYGQSAQIDKLKSICKKYNIFLIEDCAQSHGAKFNNKKTGSFGEISAFSFYPTKILGGFGDGGMCLTNKKYLDEKIKMLRFYGMKETYYSEIPKGVNSRLDEVHAAILNFKLSRIDNDIENRRRIANIYNYELADTNLILPIEKKGNFHSYYLYVVRSPERNRIMQKLKEENINLNISYPYPIHSMPAFKQYKKGKMINTNKLAKEIFSLPMYPSISESNLERIIYALKKYVKR